MIYDVGKSLCWEMVACVSLDITKPHRDTYRGGWEEI